MIFYKEGDFSKAICPHCKKIVQTTFKVRTSNITDNERILTVPHILVSVCNICDHIVSVPQQSFAAIGEIRKKEIKKSIEVRLARHQLDILNNVIVATGITVTDDLRSNLIRYYLSSLDLKKNTMKRLEENLNSDILKGKFSKKERISVKINSELRLFVDQILHISNLKQTELIESIIIEAKHDVLDHPKDGRKSSLRKFLLATA
jgi:hypothetical protein